MANADDKDDQPLVLHPVQDPVVTSSSAPHVIGSAELDGLAPARLRRKPINPSCDPAPNPLDEAVVDRTGSGLYVCSIRNRSSYE